MFCGSKQASGYTQLVGACHWWPLAWRGAGFNCHVLLSPSEIEAIKLAEQKLREERKRKAMVVVGDLHPLRDALPELQELEASRQQQQARR